MLMMEQLHQFKCSWVYINLSFRVSLNILTLDLSRQRKWKEKLREWNFDKNLTKREMKIVVAKAEKRALEDGKETIFFQNENPIPPAKVMIWQRKIAMTATSPANPYKSEWSTWVLGSL